MRLGVRVTRIRRACLGWGGTALFGVIFLAPSKLAAQVEPASAATVREAFYGAVTPFQRRLIADRLALEDIPFDTLWAALSAGPVRPAGVPTGRLEPTIRGPDGHLHRYLLLVPESYDPGRAYPLRVYLHGATYYPDPGPGGGWWPEVDLVRDESYIAVLPLAWDECLWWQQGQIEALGHIVSSVRRVFHVDDNRVYLLGVSDGGAGVYYSAAHNPTPWAAFVPMIGNPEVLENPAYGADDRTHAPNLRGRALFIVNTDHDSTHPASVIHRYLDGYAKAGVTFEYHELPGDHDLSWWDQVKPDVERFLAQHVRDPFPDSVEWISDQTERYARAYWLVVDELGAAGGGREAKRLLELAGTDDAGSVRAIRTGNRFDVETRGVRRLRILLAQGEVDMSQPVVITVNGKLVHEGIVPRSPSTLLRWAAADFDPSMLFAAEVEVSVPR